MSNELPVIIKKVKKGGRPHHHGGAWKVAYADFVTAMMAFFLLLWLLNATTEEQKRGISDYFSPQVVSRSSSGAGGLLAGQTISPPGALTSRTAVPSVSLDIKPTTGADAGDAEIDGGTGERDRDVTEEEARAVVERADREGFDEVEAKLRQAIEGTPELERLQGHLLVDRTEEGLRIQIVDQEGEPMFPLGSADMFPRTRILIVQIAAAITALPNRLSVSGHTDATPFRSRRNGYGNWELSSDRAHASRRELVAAGLPETRIAQVVGKADTELLVPDEPASAQNRRISIVLLRRVAEPQETRPERAAGGAPAPPATAPAAPSEPDLSRPRLR